MTRVARSGLVFLLAASAFIALSSCRREAPDNIDRNRAPETYITRAPAESTLTYYRVRFYWGGADPDGDIAYYEVAVTDSNRVPGQDVEEGTGYTRTLATDSLFTLAADPPVETQIIGKRLYVRAVDNEGKIDPTPARAAFQSRNDYYPDVVFHPGSASWVDKCGTMRTRVLTSSQPTAPTDTIGVGGTVTWRWGGLDRDAGGGIRSYEYKLGSQPRYQGGTLADTTATYTFPANAGRIQLLQVRAVDDGGLRTAQDATQSVVLNFDPITMILHPENLDGNGNPARERVFTWGTRILPAGVTLPDGFRSVEVRYAGNDDPRDFQTNCENPGISRYQTRILFRDDSEGQTTNPQWGDLSSSDPFPIKNTHTYNNLGSGDHFILIRALDNFLIVDSTPETVLVKVNYRPYLTEYTVRSSAQPAGEAINILELSPEEVTTLRIAEGDSLVVTALGSDVHTVPPGPLDPNDVIEPETGGIALNGYRAFLDDSPFEPSFEPTPPGGEPFTITLAVSEQGEYLLTVDVRDRTFFNPNTGRIGRVVRTLRIVR